MSLDTRYRPRNYEDVLGQEATIAILKEYVRSGRGFHQSYLFCGGHGSGKTTLGRILARALLCETPNGGAPCNCCSSCRNLLESNTSSEFTEVDAATNSGKADIKQITDDIGYQTFSGKHRIYLFDEAHQLSKDALDALLKYLEDTYPGSEDKKLTCIFCTTEPERMRATILSRCAPAFVVQPQKPDVIARRLADICQHEGISAEPDMLPLIAEVTECHIRDALKAIEGVAMLGGITKENVTAYLHLDLNSAYLDILQAIGSDLDMVLARTKQVMQKASPVTCYTKLAEVAMLAFQVSLGDTSALGFWNAESLKRLADKGPVLLGYASQLASRPGRPTAAMLLMDLAVLHHSGGQVGASPVIQVQVAAPPPVPAPTVQVAPLPTTPVPVQEAPPMPKPDPPSPGVPDQVVLAPQVPAVPVPTPVGPVDPSCGTVEPRDRDWVVDPRLVGKRDLNKPVVSPLTPSKTDPTLPPQEFARILGKHLVERHGNGSTG